MFEEGCSYVISFRLNHSYSFLSVQSFLYRLSDDLHVEGGDEVREGNIKNEIPLTYSFLMLILTIRTTKNVVVNGVEGQNFTRMPIP